MRIACVAVPRLALQALVRAEPELAQGPLALVTGKGGPSARAQDPARRAGRGSASVAKRPEAPGEAGAPSLVARVLDMNEPARAAGVQPGWTVAQARAVLPELEVRAASAAQIEAARAALGDVALGFAPQVEVGAEEAFLEVGDLGRLFRSEREIALALLARARAVGLEARVGVASSKGMARLAAWGGAREICEIAPGGEAAFVAPLPVALLGPSPEALAALGRWGIRRCQELAALPAEELALRLGAEGLRLHRLSQGRSDEPLEARAPEDAVEEGMTLDYAIVELEALAFVLRGLVARLVERLEGRHLGCAALVLRLELEHRGHDVREVRLGAPTREVATLVELVRLQVARRPPEAGVVGITVAALPARVRGAQLDLFLPAMPAPDRLAQTVARLEALVGDGLVGAPRAVDSYRDEALAVGPYRPSPIVPGERGEAGGARPGREEDRGEDRGRAAGQLALRRFRPAAEVEVLLDTGHVPRALSGRGLSAQVVVAAGPYRVQGEWWSAEGFARDYWDVHASDGTLYRLYRERTGRWFIEGYYD